MIEYRICRVIKNECGWDSYLFQHEDGSPITQEFSPRTPEGFLIFMGRQNWDVYWVEKSKDDMYVYYFKR